MCMATWSSRTDRSSWASFIWATMRTLTWPRCSRAGRGGGGGTDTLDWRMPELTAFYSVLALPHFAWSGVFGALGIALTFIGVQRGDLRLGALAGLAWLGQASIHPQMPILMGGATLVAMLMRPPSRKGWMAGALAFAIPAPYILYAYFAFVGNPEVQRWTFHSKNALP